MHLALAVITIYCTYRWADWKNWRHYHPTLLYIAAAGLLYEFLTQNYSLWVFHPDFFYNQKITILIYAFVTMPLSVLIFLSNYPDGNTIKQIGYLLKWIFAYSFTELFLNLTHKITYQFGWNFGFSVLFDVMMFPMLVLHHKHPLRAYMISIFIIIGLLIHFKVPFSFY